MSAMKLGEAFTIPEVVSASDYVLQLSTGVAHAEQTVGEYVVTDSLAVAFGEALDQIDGALRKGASQGAFIHGSFGSGKSHFMAVLDLILRGSPAARALPGLQRAISDHSDVLGKNFLTIDYHLIGAKSLEDALFSGYLNEVAARHPESAPPVLHKSDALLTDAMAGYRADPEGFLARLNGAATGEAGGFGGESGAGGSGFGGGGFGVGSAPGSGDAGFGGSGFGSGGSGSSFGSDGSDLDGAGFESGWGAFVGGWTPESFSDAAESPVGDPERERLVSELTATMFKGYISAGEWLDVSSGLAAITTHARGLGYDAVVLFLDELVLWLASHLANSDFVSVEGSKVAKLVEQGGARTLGARGGAAVRSLPIISFVARQRDLQDFLGDREGGMAGAQKMAVGQTFQWWEDRFDRIDLQAADLPKIARRRLLEPTSAAAAAEIQRALAQVRAHPKAWNVLISADEGAGADAFAEVYPFSPALVDTLVVLAPMMQRERTALKVMAQLLVNGRDTLVIDDIIPAGDLYDVVVTEGSTPISADIRAHFDNARSLYEAKLRPMLLSEHGLDEAAAAGVDRDHAFSRDDRLAKTLLLAALAPGVKAFGNLDAGKLAALNHGTVRSRVVGNEAALVLGKVRKWAQVVGEISIGEGDNPVISLDLSGVDYDSILERVANEDTEGARRRLLKEMLFAQFGVKDDNGLFGTAAVSTVWRGTRRTVDVLFGNIRNRNELPDDAFAARAGTWRMVLDYPFDESGHTPQDDHIRLDSLAADLATTTVAWVPQFLTSERSDDLGVLVRLEYLLAGVGNHFDDHAAHLPPEQRPIAREYLVNRRNALRTQLGEVLKQAYGVARVNPADIDDFGDVDPLMSLQPGFTPQPPVGATLGQAMTNVIYQMFDHQYPEHPRFDPTDAEVTARMLAVAAEHVVLAAERGGRVDPVDPAKRAALRRVVNPLRCGAAFENHYVCDASTFVWGNEFARLAARDGLGGQVPVTAIRGWLAPYGLTTAVANLLIFSWAVLEDKEFALHGTVARVERLDNIRDEYVLRDPVLPEAGVWEVAHARAASVFGESVSGALKAANVHRLAVGVRERAKALSRDVEELVGQLRAHEEVLGLGGAGAGGGVGGGGVAGATAGGGAGAAAGGTAPRLQDALLARDLVTALAGRDDEANDLDLVAVLAQAALPAESEAVVRSMSTARAVASELKGASWAVIEAVDTLAATDPDSEFGQRAAAIITTLRTAARASQMHSELSPALSRAAMASSQLLADVGGGRRVHDPDELTNEERERQARLERERLAELQRQQELQRKQDAQRVRDLEEQVRRAEEVQRRLAIEEARRRERIRIDDIDLDGLDTRLSELEVALKQALAHDRNRKIHIEWWLE